MDKKEIDLLVNQIRNIILGKQLTEDMYTTDEDLAELQEAIKHFKNNINEANAFARELTRGNLDVESPNRHNYFVGNLKELHANLRHLTWQANQVANGDYSQSVNFLGDFSNSFNRMIRQLSERESKLQEQSEILSETVDLLKSIMDGLSDWIVVTSVESNEYIYINKTARKQLFNSECENKHGCGESCALKQALRNFNRNQDYKMEFEHYCLHTQSFFCSKAHMIQWNGKLAYVHFITNITDERKYYDTMARKVYLDELTEVYNRRYCVEKLKELIETRTSFSMCLLDLDGLKYANDVFGHTAGDMYLKAVACEIKKHFRDNDIIARIGGDEMVVVSADLLENEMEARAELINENLSNQSVDYPMSASHGTIHVRENNELTLEQLFEEVDAKMYKNKKLRKKERLD